MGDTDETEDVTRWGPDGEVLGPILVSVDRRKIGADEISGMVSSDVSFDVTNDGNLEGVVPGEGDTMVILGLVPAQDVHFSTWALIWVHFKTVH